MIYLITGNMGTGKTSRAVSMILNNEDGLFKMTLEDGSVVDRPLYFCHIDGLDSVRLNAHRLSEDQIQSAPLDELLPQGAVLLVDEAHYTYPVRSASRAVPDYVQKLAELRHHGFTLILMTQHPMQLDVFVRNLVSKHIHLERKSVGMKQYFWYKCVTSLDNPAALTGTESASWKPPKEAFKYYKSASQHQKFKKRIPPVLFILLGLLFFIAWKSYNLYQSANDAILAANPSVSSASAPFDSSPVTNQKNNASLGSSLEASMFVPTLAEKPESKPIYDTVRQVKVFERVAGCIKGNSGCTCYTDQATVVKEVTQLLCESYVTNGLPFNPYKDSIAAGLSDKTDSKSDSESSSVTLDHVDKNDASFRSGLLVPRGG